jgi:hypothetical protein
MTISSTLHWVVRGGIATPDSLQLGYSEHKAVLGLYGFSVQYAPGQTLDALALAGRFRNAQLSYADANDLAQAVLPLGYAMRLVQSPGHGFHHTFAVLYTANNNMLQSLPRDAAEAISQTFQRMPNPHQMP